MRILSHLILTGPRSSVIQQKGFHGCVLGWPCLWCWSNQAPCPSLCVRTPWAGGLQTIPSPISQNYINPHGTQHFPPAYLRKFYICLLLLWGRPSPCTILDMLKPHSFLRPSRYTYSISFFLPKQKSIFFKGTWKWENCRINGSNGLPKKHNAHLNKHPLWVLHRLPRDAPQDTLRPVYTPFAIQPSAPFLTVQNAITLSRMSH